MEQNKIWKEVSGFEGLYAVSNNGEIKGLKSGKILRPRPTKNDYLMVYLSKNGKQKNYLIHRLVAQEFINNPDGKLEVNHLDGDKSNNCTTNLEWSTRGENTKHAFKIGLRHVNKDKIIESKRKSVCQIDISTGDIIRIWKSSREASRVLNISQSNISMCCNGKRNHCGGFLWRYLEGGEI